MTEWKDIPEIPILQPIEPQCVEVNTELFDDSQAMMRAALGIGPQTGKRSWEYILPPEKENHGNSRM